MVDVQSFLSPVSETIIKYTKNTSHLLRLHYMRRTLFLLTLSILVITYWMNSLVSVAIFVVGIAG